MSATGGIRFGQYVLLRRIARGGMAEVFLAQQRGLEGFDRRVAVKRILPHLLDSPDFVKMFLGEAKLAAQLTHPNIVHIYEFGKVAGDYFIAMEYVDGVHAGHLFKHDDRMPYELVARIGADAAAALHYAHELKGPNGKPLDLVHRDVSPANIMISYDGTVRLCDFGIAKAAALSDQLTNPGQVKGKYAYMSPEQTIASPLDGRSDVFSLSIVLWELLVGDNIVSRGDAVDAMRAIRDGKLEPVSHAAPHVPRALADAIDWGLQNKRDRRATAAELAQALESFIKSSPDLATPMQLGHWIRARFVRDSTNEVPSIESVDTPRAEPQGTAVVHGTSVASPGTTVGTPTNSHEHAQQPSQPPHRHSAHPNLIAASRLQGPDVDDGAETVFSGPPAMTGERGPSGQITVASSPLNVTWSGEERPVGIDNSTTIAGDPIVIPDTPGGTTLAVTSPDFQFSTGSGRLAPGGPHDGPSFGSGSHSVVPLGASTLKEIQTNSSPRADEEPTNRADSRPRRMPNRAPTERGHDRGPAAAAMHNTRYPMTRQGPGGYEPTADIRGRRGAPRRVVVVGVLALLALASFLVVVVLHSLTHGDTMLPDASILVAPDAPSSAIAPGGAGSTGDAAAATPPGPDAEPGVGSDSTASTLLEVRTSPSGAMVSVGDQSSQSPAQLALPAGHYVVVARLDGYEDEKREVDLPSGEHLLQEIAFTKQRPHQGNGYLTVTTETKGEVFINSKTIGDAPVEDHELPAGRYELVFRSRGAAPITRKVTIVDGQTTKISL